MPTARWTYASFGCAAFADNARTYAYHQWAKESGLYSLDCCPRLDDCSCPNDSQTWTDPVTDDAPWIDPNNPHSEEFLGVMIMKVTGVNDSTLSRDVVDGFNEGTILGRDRLRGKTMVFEMLVLGYTCAGVDYGIEWLRKLTERSICQCQDLADPCEQCTGRQLTLRKFCPDIDPGDCDHGLRTWDSVGVVDGVKEVDDEQLKQLCCCLRKVTMTMQTESPYSYSCPRDYCEGELVADEDNYTRCYDWRADCLTCDTCDACDRCGRDSICNCFPLGDLEIIVPENECFCEPIEKVFSCCCIDDITDDTAIVLDIYSGSDPGNDLFTDLGARNMVIKVYDNPDNMPCITDQDSWDAWALVCAERLRFELNVSYIPSDSTLTIDGRSQRVTLTCDGVCRPFDQVVTSLTGQIFPFTSACGSVMICIEWDKYNTQFELAGPAVPSEAFVTTYRQWLN